METANIAVHNLHHRSIAHDNPVERQSETKITKNNGDNKQPWRNCHYRIQWKKRVRMCFVLVYAITLHSLFRKSGTSLHRDVEVPPSPPQYVPPVVCSIRSKKGACVLHPGPCHAVRRQQKEQQRINPPHLSPYGFVEHANGKQATAMQVSGSAERGSGCALSHSYKFIYIHVLKSGGMTFKKLLRDAFCGNTNGTTAKRCGPVGNETFMIVNCGAAVRSHPDYFVWSFVRDPYKRLYSGYAMAMSMSRQPMKSFPSFREFALADNHNRYRMSRTSPSHYYPQIKFLFNRANCPVFDFIGRLEHLWRDFDVIRRHIGSPELDEYMQSVDETVVRANNTAYGAKLRQKGKGGDMEKAQKDSAVVNAVIKEFKEDHQLLGYDVLEFMKFTMDT